MNAEAVGDAENFPRMQIRLDGLLVNLSLRLIWREHVDPVGALGSLIGGYNDHAVGTRLLGAGAVWVKTDNDLVSAVAEILRLRVSLAAVAEDRDGLTLQRLGLGISFVENFYHQRAPLVHKGWKEALACREKFASILQYRPVGRYLEMLPVPSRSVKGEVRFREPGRTSSMRWLSDAQLFTMARDDTRDHG